MFAAVIVIATLYAVVATRGVARLPSRRSGIVARIVWHPLAQLGLVCGLIFVNQVLCDAYIVGHHGGDPSFITRYLGRGWFDIVHVHIDVPGWLGVTVLRVQAFLELPFTLFAYLAVARLLGRDLHRTLVRPALLVGAAVAFTVTFSLVELSLPNPWTTQDIVVRAIACAITPLWVALASHLEGDAPREAAPTGLVGLLAFLVGAGALAYIVLALYDAFLLYNLAHLPAYAPGLAAATATAIAATWLAPRIDLMIGARSDTMAGVAQTLARFTLVFFIPSLALRYRAIDPIAQVAGLVVIAVAIVDTRAWWTKRLGACAIAAAAGISVGGALAIVAGAQLPEGTLACFALGFLVTAIATLRIAELLSRGASTATGR